MKRETLNELGLTKEQIDSVMGEHGKSLNDLKERLATAEGERDQFKNQYEDQKSELETIFAEKTKDFAIHHALENSKTLDSELVKGLLDREKITVEGNELSGLAEQLKELKESKSFLFESEETPAPAGFKAIPNMLKDSTVEPGERNAFTDITEKYQ